MADITYLKGSCVNCGNHIEFPQAMTGRAVACPHCGQSTELIPGNFSVAPAKPQVPAPQAKGLGVGLLVGACLFAALAVAAFVCWMFLPAREPLLPMVKPSVSIPASPPPKVVTPLAAPTAKAPKSPSDFKVGEIKLENTKGSTLVYAVGVLTNDSDYQRFGVHVELDLLNGQDAKIGSAQDYQGVIEPRKTWSFRALVVDSKAVSTKLAAVKED
jgi:hypothetical protein